MKEQKVLSGGKLAGGNPENERVENDYYATDPKAVKLLLDNYKFKGKAFLEPCVAAGNIASTVLEYYNSNCFVDGIDIVDRGYPNTIVADYLTYKTDDKYDCIISNPPFSLAKEFIEKSLNLLNDDGQIAMFLKIQFLEGTKRKEFFQNNPPKYIYVFRNRMATWNNGDAIDPKTGKKWATTMCHAWFVWENGSRTEPIIRWL
ncbi:hypothetical protein [Anaerosporobacter sp.]